MVLTHRGREKIPTYSNIISWKKTYEYRLLFPNGEIYNIAALAQTMAWRRPSDKPLSEPMMVEHFMTMTVKICYKILSKTVPFSGHLGLHRMKCFQVIIQSILKHCMLGCGRHKSIANNDLIMSSLWTMNHQILWNKIEIIAFVNMIKPQPIIKQQ